MRDSIARASASVAGAANVCVYISGACDVFVRGARGGDSLLLLFFRVVVVVGTKMRDSHWFFGLRDRAVIKGVRC